MSTSWHGKQNIEEIKIAAARGLIRASHMFQQQMRQRVSIPNPPPHLNSSKPGEYPRLRTGEGQRALMQEEKTFQEVLKRLAIKVGFDKGKAHLLALELKAARLGLVRTLTVLRDVLKELAIAEFRK